MKLNSQYKGFSLVEIMVTLAIVAIITAIAAPLYTGYIETVRRAEGQNNLDTLFAAEANFFADNGTYFSGANVTALFNNSGNIWAVAETVDADQNFVYDVTAGSTGSIATSFTATATGRGAGYDVPATVVLTVGN